MKGGIDYEMEYSMDLSVWNNRILRTEYGILGIYDSGDYGCSHYECRFLAYETSLTERRCLAFTSIL